MPPQKKSPPKQKVSKRQTLQSDSLSKVKESWGIDVDLAALLESISDHASLIDRDFNILWANETARKIFGNDIIGQKCYEAFQGRKEPCKPFPCQTMKVFEEGKPSKGERKAVNKNGKEVYFHVTANAVLHDESDTPCAVMEISRNITNQKLNEKALKESEDRFRRLYEMAPLAYQSLDFDGMMLEVNKAWLDLFGYDRDEVIGKSFGDFLLDDWKEHFKYNFPRFKDKGEILGVEFHVSKKDGSQVLISVDGKIGYDEKGNFKQTHCILHDITERRQAEEEKERLIGELQEALNKVKTLSGFLPICASCKKIRDDKGYWNQIEHYIKKHSGAEFSHSICPDCAKKLYPDLYGKK